MRRRGALRTGSEPDFEREQVVHPPQIDLRGRERLIARQVALPALIADFKAGPEPTNRHANPPKDARPHRRAAARERAVENRRILRHRRLVIDELTRLAVPPPVDADARTDIRNDRRTMAERQYAHRRIERDDA